MLKPTYPYFLAGAAVAANADLIVTNKFHGAAAARVALADAKTVQQAIAAAATAAEAVRRWPSYKRRIALEHVVRRLAARDQELAHVIAVEAGKPIRDARGEVSRAIDTFRIAAEESSRLHGEHMALDISPRAEGCEGIWKRVPVGPCAFITPFNFPLNLVAHKVAPALAAGCPFILKPALTTPISAVIVGEILAETDLPRGSFSILPCHHEDAEPLITDDRIKLLSFTGSPAVGWGLKAKSGKKKVLLELGGNAACIVDRRVNVSDVGERLIFGAFYQSGQSCISVQRIIAHRAIYDELAAELAEKAGKLASGDPLDEDTFLGPLITEQDAMRIEAWVSEAIERGAEVLVGGKRDGNFYEATILTNVDPTSEVNCKEVFGPVATLQPFDDFNDALNIVNDSDYGLQAGVFTNDLDHAFRAFNELEVGGVIINDVPSARVDSMPYGGVKNSGLGREGVRFAMEEMTEIRLMLLKGVGRA